MKKQTNLSIAIKMVAELFDGKYDKGGEPYIFHLMRVSNHIGSEDEDARVIALLHDVVEDIFKTMDKFEEYLKREYFGFYMSKEMLDALDRLTKRKGEEYSEYLNRVCGSEMAMIIKLSDLRDNMNLQRLGRATTGDDMNRMAKYKGAMIYIQGELAKTFTHVNTKID